MIHQSNYPRIKVVRLILTNWLACLLLTTRHPTSAASSSVIGWYSVTVPAGNSSWTSALVCADLYQSAVMTVTADLSDGKALVSFPAPGWTGGEFTKHYAEPMSGASAGLAIDVLSNTADTLKLDTTPAAAGISIGMTIVLRKHCTLAGLMPDGGGFYHSMTALPYSNPRVVKNFTFGTVPTGMEATARIPMTLSSAPRRDLSSNPMPFGPLL